jgi:hypothetical protein
MSTMNYIALGVMIVFTVLYIMRRRARIRREDRD